MNLGIELSCNPLLSELLSLPVFRGSRVLGGEAGLGRPVTGVNLSDTPDYYNWLCEGEVMVTTCYAIHGDPSALDQFIPTLAARGLSGLCLKPGRYLGQTPSCMIKSAQALDFPLVELPEQVRFSDITKAVSDEVLKRQTALLRSTLRVNEMLTRTIVEGAGLDEIAGMVCALTGGSVLILDSINDRRALSLTEGDVALFAGQADSAVYAALIAGGQMHVLEVGGHSFGFLYVHNTDPAFTEQDEAVMAQVLQAIPLEIARERTVRESGDRHFNDFLLHILSDHILDEPRERARAESFGLDLDQNHLIIRARLSERRSESNKYAGVFQRTLLSNEIKSTLTNLGLCLRLVRGREEYLLLLSSPLDNHGFAAVAGRFPAMLERLNGEYTALSVAAGCGRPHVGISGIVQSDREARIALKAACARGSGLYHFDDLGLLRLVYASDPEREIGDFVSETLGGLLDPGQPRGAELLLTLESYFHHFGNLKRISEELFAHYNTVVYRLKSIREITGLDVHIPAERFRLELALNLYRSTGHASPEHR